MYTYATLGTNNPERSARFFDAVLATLGIRRCGPEGAGWLGWGTWEAGGHQELALWVVQPFDGLPAVPGNGPMLAFKAATRNQVDAFHAAALANGGTSEGPPGIRERYAPDFYVAYVRDPEGNKLAAVCRGDRRVVEDPRPQDHGLSA